MTAETDAVQCRLDDLAADSRGLESVARYWASARGTSVSAGDLLLAIRTDEALALETRDSMGRDVICAATDESGETRYCRWQYSGLSGEPSASWDRRRDVVDALEDRRPLIRLRAETPLSELEPPAEFERTPEVVL